MNKLNITDRVLDKLGFSEYWDEHGTWGGRTLTFSNGTKFRIIEQEEMDDDSEGYSSDGKYVANHFYFAGWFALPKSEAEYHELFFLHQMYECIKDNYPDCLDEFVAKCEELKMKVYIDEYMAEEYMHTKGIISTILEDSEPIKTPYKGEVTQQDLIDLFESFKDTRIP